MRIITWNVNSINVRLEHVLKVLEDYQPDVLAIQETKVPDEKFPQEAIETAGYHLAFSGQKTYNGMCIISKYPMTDIVTEFDDFDDVQKRLLVATINGYRIINVYVPNGQSLESDKYNYKLDWLKRLNILAKQQLAEHEKVVILGDYNIAPEDQDVHDPKAWAGNILVSPQERAAFQALLDLGYKDSFRLFEQPEKVYSWWDYRQLGLQKNRGLRIDHILVSPALAASCQKVMIDKAPRKWQRPSDHTVVIADF